MPNFQQWYLQTLVVPTAQNFGRTEEHTYINPNLERFLLRIKQVKLAYQTGFTHAVYYLIAIEVIGVLVAIKWDNNKR